MSTFSERYGYVTPRESVIKEDMPQEVVNAVCSCLDDLRANYDGNMHYNYSCLERNVWRYFLNNKSSDFSIYNLNKVLSDYVSSTGHPWYKKLDLLEKNGAMKDKVKFFYTVIDWDVNNILFYDYFEFKN